MKFYLCFLFILIFLLCGCNSNYEIKQNIQNSENKAEISIKNTDSNLQKGLNYIGEMNVPRLFHSIIKINDNQFLVVGGCNKIEEDLSYFPKKGDYHNSGQKKYIPDFSAEIFNAQDNTFAKIKSKLTENIFTKILNTDNNKLLLISDKYEIFDTKTKDFTIINKEDISSKISYNPKPMYAELIGDKRLIECFGYEQGPENIKNTCWITDLTDFKVKEIQNIKLNIPNNLTPCDLGYLKLNNNEILIYTKSYPGTYAKNLYLAVWDINNKKIVKEKEAENVGNLQLSFPPVLLKNNKILFNGGITYDNISMNPHTLQPWFIYDFKNNCIEKTDITIRAPLYQLSDGRVLIINGNKINKVFNPETKQIESFEGFEIENISNFNIYQISDNRFLITGGNKKDSDEISSSAWIYAL